MKQKLFKSWLLMMCLLFGVGQSWAETKTIEINTTNSGVTGSYADKTFDVGDVTFGFTQWMKSNNIQAKKSTTNSCYNVDAIPGTIKKITVEQTGTYRAITMYGGTSSKPTTQITSPKTDGTMVFDFSGKNYTYFSMTTPGNAVYISTITIEYETSGGSTTPTATYTVTLGDDSSTLTQEASGTKVTLPTRTGNETYTFVGWSVNNITQETTTAPTIILAGDYTPSADVTLYPVYRKTEKGTPNSVTQDYETAVAPTGWSSKSITRTNGTGISSHGGSYWGSIAVNGTAYIQYNTALTGNVSVTAYVARTTNNSNKGEFKIQSKSSSSSSWTDRATLDVASSTVDEWQELSWTGTLNGEQVQVLYTGGTTAIRAIDDVTITNTPEINYYISSLPVSKTLTSIAVSGAPTKTIYEAGENFDPTGLTVTGTYDDNSQETITSGITWSTPAALTAGQTSVDITATVSGITSASYTVTGLTVTAPKTLSSIAVKTAPTKTTYTEGEKFDPAGLVITKTMSDDTTEDIVYAGNEASFSFEPSLETALATTDTKVTITYGEKTCEQAITVKEAAKYTVTFNAQAGTCAETSLTEETAGAGITLPTATCLNSDWTFAGWATAACEETTTAPTLNKAGANYKPTADITLYAVYMTGAEEGEIAFNRVTALSQIKNGDKVVVVHNSTNYAMTLSAGDNATVENVNTISMSAVKKIWTVAITEDIYTFTDNQSSPKTLSTSGVPKTSTENIASVGAKGSSNNSYKYADWNISASSIENCWVLTNTYTTDNGSAALTVNSNPQWGVLNVNKTDGPRDASVFAMRIYVEGPTTNATYNSNPVETGIISIRTPEGYATYSDTRNFIVPKDLTVSVVALGENNKLEIINYSTDDVVEAGTGVLVYGTTGDHKIVYTNDEQSQPLGRNDLYANQTESAALAKYLVVANYYYVLCYDMNDKNLGFYWFNENGDGEFYVPAQKVILALPNTISAKAAYVLSEDSATGISAIENKVNGDAVYNLAGQRVATKGYKGIVIKNGKKILVK